MKNQVQLITYIDRIGCSNVNQLNTLLQNQLQSLFGGVHLLPFFYPIDGEDAGFDPIDHNQIDERLGKWNDVKELSLNVDVMADLIVNHMSAESTQFKDYLENGENSKFAPLFLTFDKVFPDGATEQDLISIYRPRPSFPFTKFKLKDGGEKMVWTTFTQNQIDIDVYSELGKQYLETILDTFQKAGVNIIRLDAAGYAIKKQGTSCFMIDETFEFIAELTKSANKRNIEVLVEIHSYYKTQIEIAKKVDYVYDFALPVLVLDTIFNKNSQSIKKWLEISPKNVITVLDTHDGIGIVDVASEGDEPGLIEDDVLDDIVNQMHINSKGNSLKATGAAASNLDLYQVNSTFYDALGGNDNDYLLARAIQFFVPGVPQVYYVGLLFGENDMDLLKNTNVGRDINRHYFTEDEINQLTKENKFEQLKRLMIFRNTNKAFNGEFSIVPTSNEMLILEWKNNNHWAQLKVDLNSKEFEINYSEFTKLSTLKFDI